MYQRTHSRLARGVGAAALSVILFSVSSCGGDDGGSSADFCKIATKLEDESPIDDAFSGEGTPDDLKAAMEEMVKDVNALEKSAPDEIAKEAKLVKESFTALADLLADSDYDIATAFQSPEFAALGEKFDSDEFNEAGDKLDTYLATECGITSGS
jgi:hypothetical protein